jgi:predicted enzyme related to lactoylglutathione lyase
MGRPVAFFEITSRDAERAQEFYRRLFEWRVDADPALGGYAMVDTGAGEGSVGGGIGPAETQEDAGVRIYMRVDDLDAHLRRAEELGGKIVSPPADLPEGWGRMAMLADPDGNAVGLWA